MGSAQQTYHQLVRSEVLGGAQISLFHARYPLRNRINREQAALGDFGPKAESADLRILVATQVIEQSLDLDFDLMIY